MFTYLFFLLLLFSLFQYQKKNYVLSILIIFSFLTGGFQIIPPYLFDSGFGINKPYDYAILFVIITFILEFKQNVQIINENKIVKLISLFLIFIVFLICYNVFINNYELLDVLKPSRKIFLLLFLFNLLKLERETLEKIFNILLKITLIQSIIYLLQIPLNTVLLNDGVFESTPNLETVETLWIRYYNTPNLLLIFLFYTFFKIITGKDESWTKFLIFLLTTLAPLHRSLIISLIITFFIIIYTTKIFRLKYTHIILFFFLSLLIIFPQFLDRITSGISESVSSFTEESQLESPDNNLAFRIAHLVERADYIFEKRGTILFGIGFLPEDAPQTKLLSFAIGYVTDENEITQIDTADIAWSLIIVYTGLTGLLFYGFTYFSVLRFFWQRKMDNIFARIGLANLLVLFFISFTSSSFFDQIAFYQIPFLIALVKNSINEKLISK